MKIKIYLVNSNLSTDLPSILSDSEMWFVLEFKV